MGASKSFNIILHDPIITIQCHHWMVFSANFVTPEAQVVTASAAKLLSSHLVGCLIVAGDRSTNLSRLQKWRPVRLEQPPFRGFSHLLANIEPILIDFVLLISKNIFIPHIIGLA